MEDTLEYIKCPACGKEMQKVLMPDAGVNLDVCLDGCGGIFSVAKANGVSVEDLKKAIEGKTFEKVDESLTRVCPVCGNNMVKNNVSIKKEITIDECYNCGAKFFDNGELTKMREQYSTEEDRRQAFISATYRDIGSQIDAMEFQNNMNYAKRSKFLKALDKIFLGK